jgi:hypothetical protein
MAIYIFTKKCLRSFIIKWLHPFVVYILCSQLVSYMWQCLYSCKSIFIINKSSTNVNFLLLDKCVYQISLIFYFGISKPHIPNQGITNQAFIKKWVVSFSSCVISAILLQYIRRWVIWHCMSLFILEKFSLRTLNS